MVKMDMKAIEEMKIQAEEAASREIAMARAKGDELTEEDEKVIRNKFLFKATQILHAVSMLGPKKLLRSGYGVVVGSGWRDGYTKSPISKRGQKRNERNKLTRAARQAQRRIKKGK